MVMKTLNFHEIGFDRSESQCRYPIDRLAVDRLAFAFEFLLGSNRFHRFPIRNIRKLVATCGNYYPSQIV